MRYRITDLMHATAIATLYGLLYALSPPRAFSLDMFVGPLVCMVIGFVYGTPSQRRAAGRAVASWRSSIPVRDHWFAAGTTALIFAVTSAISRELLAWMPLLIAIKLLFHAWWLLPSRSFIGEKGLLAFDGLYPYDDFRVSLDRDASCLRIDRVIPKTDYAIRRKASVPVPESALDDIEAALAQVQPPSEHRS